VARYLWWNDRHGNFLGVLSLLFVVERWVNLKRLSNEHDFSGALALLQMAVTPHHLFFYFLRIQCVAIALLHAHTRPRRIIVGSPQTSHRQSHPQAAGACRCEARGR
jgi:hypothetical protein